MIPILFDRTANPKTILANTHSMGLGLMAECISATVTEERNGIFELEIEYPLNGKLINYINYCSWIKANPSVNEGYPQLFRVYKISRTMHGTCMIYAEHVSYLLSYATVKWWKDGLGPSSMTCADAMLTIENNIMSEKFKPSHELAFSYSISIESTAEEIFWMDTAKSVKEYLLGDEGSLLSVYDGNAEFYFDNFQVTMTDARGSDRGVTIEYGKNLTNLKAEFTDENIITGYYPYWTKRWAPITTLYPYGGAYHRDINSFDEELSPIVYDTYAQGNFPFYERILPLNLADFDDWKSFTDEDVNKLQLEDFYYCVRLYKLAHPEARNIINSLDVSFVDLSSTEEYKNILPLETIKLCDEVTVKYPDFDINQSFKVVRTEYNVLEDRYNKITLGSLKDTLWSIK